MDVTTPTGRTDATAWELYPTTSGKLYDDFHDLALVSFAAAAGTPVMPIVPPADYLGLAPGAPLLAVGYGQTSPAGGAGLPNTRNKLPVALDSFLRSAIETSSTSGATCFGDGGGALIESSTGADRLIGVNRAGSSCNAGAQNEALGFFAPEIASWLRRKGLVAPDALQPIGADCTSPSACASGACEKYLLDYDDAGVVVSLCSSATSGSPLPSSSTWGACRSRIAATARPRRPPPRQPLRRRPTAMPAPAEDIPIVRVSNCAMAFGGGSDGTLFSLALALVGVAARRRRRAPL